MQFSYPEYNVYLIYFLFFLTILFLSFVDGDIENEFVEDTSIYQVFSKRGVPYLFWPRAKIMTPRESMDICTRVAKFLNTPAAVEPTADAAFPDSVLVLFLNKKYSGTKTEALACKMESTQNYFKEKSYMYITLGQHRESLHCYFVLKPFRDKTVSVRQKVCVFGANQTEENENGSNDSAVSAQKRNMSQIENSDDVDSFGLEKYYQVEDEFVAYFGNGSTRVLWSAARNVYNSWELELICNQLKRLQGENGELIDSFVHVGNLHFLQINYRKMPIDVISCGIMNAENYLLHIFATRGEFDDCYFLLDQFKYRNFYVKEHVCLSDLNHLDHAEYNQLEDEFVTHFKNDGTPVIWRYIHNSPSNSTKLLDVCNRMKWIRADGIVVSSVFADTIDLMFRNKMYKNRRVDIIGCKIVGKYHIHFTISENDACFYLLFRFQNDKFYVGRHFCVENNRT